MQPSFIEFKVLLLSQYCVVASAEILFYFIGLSTHSTVDKQFILFLFLKKEKKYQDFEKKFLFNLQTLQRGLSPI